jgi:molybdate transport system ATP-binding protein
MTPFHLSFAITSRFKGFELNLEAEFRQLVTGVFGVSGAGKTTFLRCLAGLEKNISGNIFFNGAEWLNSEKQIFLRPEVRRIGYVPQNGLLFPNKNVMQNLLIASHRRRTTEGNGHTAVSLELVCALLELDTFLERPINKLSGGERQRIALGRAICSDPDLLLLDEPLAALDLKLKRQILPFLRRIRDELKIPMIVISHSPVEIQALCDEVLVIQNGKKLAFGQTQKILLSQNVLEFTHGESYENILPVKVLLNSEERSSKTGMTRLEISDGVSNSKNPHNLIIRKVDLKAGEKLIVGIPAKDIILATHKPQGISAQNIIPARVNGIETVGDKCLISNVLSNEELEINVELTVQGLRNLNLQIGDAVFLIIKASACVVYR